MIRPLLGAVTSGATTIRVAVIEIDGHTVITVNRQGRIEYQRTEDVKVIGSLPDVWQARGLVAPVPTNTLDAP